MEARKKNAGPLLASLHKLLMPKGPNRLKKSPEKQPTPAPPENAGELPARGMGAPPAQSKDAARMWELHRASQAITRAMSIVPESQIVAAIHRGFRVWPYRAPAASDFLTPVLQTIVNHIREVLGAEMSALGVGRFPSQPFEPWVVSGVSEDLRARFGTPRPVGTLGAVAIQGQKVRIKDIRTHANFRGFPAGHPEVRSLLAMPVRINGTSLGNLYVGNKIGKEEFTEEDEWIAETLAGLCGAAIQQAYIQSTVEIQQSQVQALLDSVPSGVIFVDKQTGNMTANSAAMELFGESLAEVVTSGKYRRSLLGPKGEEMELADAPSTHAMSGKTVLGQEMQIYRADGTHIPVRVNAAPVLGLMGEVMGAVVVFENVSLEKKLDQVRQQMAAMIMHDVRNPMQVILMNAQSMMRGKVGDPKTAAQLQLIEKNAHRVIALTNKLLDVARIESGQIKLDLQAVELKEYIESVIMRAEGAYPDHQIRLLAPQVSAKARLDADRVDQVITNLIDNAAKYSPPGTEIEVRLSIEPEGFDISVRDEGPGLTPDELVQIFDPYRRAVAGYAVRGGLGLGLFIVRGIVEAHGGRVSVESKVGKGSTFSLHFPSTLHERIAAA